MCYLVVIFGFAFLGQIGVSHGQNNQRSRSVSLTFLDNTEMPLYAKFDTSKLNQNIKQYIDNQLKNLTHDLAKQYLQESVDSQLRNLTDDLAKRLDKVEKRISDPMQGKVAFSSYMSNSVASKSKSLTSGATVIFDRTLTNEKGAYSTSTGRFNAPITGLYAFTWTICVDSRVNHGGWGEYGTQLVYGSSVIGVLHADTETEGDDTCSTGFVIHNVQSTTTPIFLKVMYAHQGQLLSKDEQSRSTFTGWQLY